MKLEQRDLLRWFKKGWAMALSMVLLSFISNSFIGASWSGFVAQIAANPTGAVGALIGLTIIAAIWVLALAPVIIGWLVEFIDRKIRK